MTTPAPVKSTTRARRQARRREAAARRPRLRMSLYGFLLAWLLPNLIMAAIVMVLSMIPELQVYGTLTPLLVVVGIATLVVGLPLCLLVNWAFRHVLNQWVHVLGYALVGMLFGLVVLTQGVGGVLPMLIPVIGFPAGILMALGRTAAQPFTRVVEPARAEPDPAD